MKDLIKALPSSFKKDIKTAIKILHDAGCTEIFIFGSVAHGKFHENSDIDIAVRGCPNDLYFKILGQLLVDLDHSVELIDLDEQLNFSKFLIDHGELVRVA